jgi:hypothetical protein
MWRTGALLCSLTCLFACSRFDDTRGDAERTGNDGGFDLDAGIGPLDASIDSPTRECRPSRTFCHRGEVATCGPDGTITETMPCGAGTVCANGACVDPCDVLALGATYEGCIFRGTAPPSMLSGHGGPRMPELGFGFHNSEAGASTVEITGGSLSAPVRVTIAPGSSVFTTVPLIHGVFDRAAYGVAPTVLARDTASYRIRATSPIVAYQFSPDVGLVIDEARFLMKADATVLFPTHVWGREYRVATMRPFCVSSPCEGESMTFMQVIADTDGTDVEVDVAVATEASADGVVSLTTVTEEPIAAIAPGAPIHVMLDAGDVLQLASAGDLAGSRIRASQPIQVLSGNVGVRLEGSTSALGDGHLHEALLPVASWGRTYVSVPPPHPTRAEALEHRIRLIAGNAPAHVTFDPPISAPVDLAAGAHVDVDPAGPARIVSDQRILVLGMSSASDVPAGNSAEQPYGAASMVAYPPVEQWRTQYGFSVPTAFDYAHVVVVIPTGATVEVDGAPVTGAVAIGTTGLSFAMVAVDRAVSSHHAVGTQAFALTVYGQAAGSSYWYAAGLDAYMLI